MANDLQVVRSYAEAIFKSAKKVGKQEEALKQMQAVQQLINDAPKLQQVLFSPIIPKVRKFEFIKLIANKLNLEIIVEQFLLLLAKNGRLLVLSDLLEYYLKLLNESTQIKEVHLISAGALDETEKEKLSQDLVTMLKCQINIHFTQDPAIIGGIIIKYDSLFMDYSIAGALNKILKAAKDPHISAKLGVS